jgi:hypothetical protein
MKGVLGLIGLSDGFETLRSLALSPWRGIDRYDDLSARFWAHSSSCPSLFGRIEGADHGA